VTRRSFFLSGAAATTTSVGAYAAFIEKWRVEVTRTPIALPGLARPTRLVQLSDLHLGRAITLDHLHYVAGLAIDARPDLICLTGDYVDYPDVGYDPAYQDVFRRLSRAAPCFATLGNHDGAHGILGRPYPGDIDHSTVRARLSAGGVHLLHNDSATCQGLNLVGVGDLWSLEVKPDEAFARAPRDGATILLNHNPDAKDLLIRHPWHLMLAGHTHGNQIHIPGISLSRWAVVEDPRYIAGHYHWKGRQLHINRGIGGLNGIRFNCRPEVSVLELTPA
jgi:predicted MPP superfamily phosphohydrolase